MSALVIALRLVPLFAFAGAMLLSPAGPGGGATMRRRPSGRDRAPVVANFAAFGVYVTSLLVSSGGSEGSAALLLAAAGALVGVAAAGLVLKSRAALGPAWSLVPQADPGTGLVTTGPYRLVRHPIYLGLALLAMGEALAFRSWPALTVVFCGIIPTLAWRARTEEKVLGRMFGDRYSAYRERTRMIIPYLL